MRAFWGILLLWFVGLQLHAQPVQSVFQGCRRGKVPPHAIQQRVRRAFPSDPANNPYLGQRRQLTVLAAFADRPFKGNESATLIQWDKIFNTVNLSEGAFVGSVRDYFAAQSYDGLQLSFDLQYVALPFNHGKYGSTREDDENSQYLVDDIIDILRQRDIDWSLYDWNGDGEIEQLLIVFAGKGSGYGGFGGDRNSIWPHQWWMSWHIDQQASGSTEKFREPLVVNSSGTNYIVDRYCVLQEQSSQGDYSIFGTLCHEYSHCLGLPDFYNGDTQYVGQWDLMDYGNNNGGGFCPCGYSAHERMLMGWLTPIELLQPCQVSDMPAVSEEPVAYLVRNDGWKDEYYIVENRQRRGWDTYLPGSGIVVFHIDYSPDVWISFTEMPNSSVKKRYTIIPANNQSMAYSFYMAGWAYPYMNNNELTDSSLPSSMLNNRNIDGSLYMGKPLTDIRVDDGLASFVFCDGASAIGSPNIESFPAASRVLYSCGPLDIIRLSDGSIQKVITSRRRR